MIKFRLTELLKRRGRSARWLSKEAVVAYTTVHKLKTGEQDGITFPVLTRICKALECTPNDLMVDDEEAEQRKGQL